MRASSHRARRSSDGNGGASSTPQVKGRAVNLHRSQARDSGEPAVIHLQAATPEGLL
ncbi:MAG TPA: hypothetical protein VKV29_00475 [Chthonomonas sp.]|uniref:hypothetical protein n=1 Tax=Chthonomonas sp. TaxID=2282153 RepID=UPI002B4AE221|nr:hypothetical protein [Chthonomonas sp.]HLH78738.1 hypothetical protein [Chthonomonas sp.]